MSGHSFPPSVMWVYTCVFSCRVCLAVWNPPPLFVREQCAFVSFFSARVLWCLSLLLPVVMDCSFLLVPCVVIVARCCPSNDDVPEDAGEGDECAEVGRESLARLTVALKGAAVLGVAANLVKVLLGLAPQDPANPLPFAGSSTQARPTHVVCAMAECTRWLSARRPLSPPPFFPPSCVVIVPEPCTQVQ